MVPAFIALFIAVAYLGAALAGFAGAADREPGNVPMEKRPGGGKRSGPAELWDGSQTAAAA